MTMELQMLARACGKTNVHSLEPEDLAALTVEASAMARVPLAGTTYTVGQTEREILAEVQRLLAIKAEEELAAEPDRAGHRPALGGRDELRTTSPTPSRRRSSRSTPSSSRASASRTRRTSRSSTTSISWRDTRRGPELARGHRAPRGGRRPGRVRPLLERVPEDLLRRSRRAGRTRSRARCS